MRAQPFRDRGTGRGSQQQREVKTLFDRTPRRRGQIGMADEQRADHAVVAEDKGAVAVGLILLQQQIPAVFRLKAPDNRTGRSAIGAREVARSWWARLKRSRPT